MKKILQHSGHHVVGIADSMEATLPYFTKKRIDLVLMDMKINGDKDGLAVAKILQTRKETAILYITAYSDNDFLDRAKETNVIGYLAKPIQPNTLLHTIEISMLKFMQSI